MTSPLERSQALWNRDHLDLRSEETLAQILDRGSLDDWRDGLPASWAPGRVWSFVLLDEEGEIVRRLTVRVTSKPAEACIAGDWRKVEVLDERPRRSGGLADGPAYAFEDGRFILELNPNLCDAYYSLVGRFSELGVNGTHGPLGLDGGEILGRFDGVPVDTSARR